MSGQPQYANWIAVDWGTSHLRAWAMDAAGSPRAEKRSDRGMGRLAPDQFEPALIELIDPWLGAAPMRIVACGMVGSRQGWVEAPYATVPCRPLSDAVVRAPARDRRLDVHIVPGVKQTDPADVMRGEETQVTGFLARDPKFDGILCLPGTHTKWVHISAGEIVSFRTFMTGELFAAIGKSTVLRHSIGTGWDDGAFADAVTGAISRPEQLAGQLFSVRADALLHGLSGSEARARLSGTLIGAELAAARPYWLGCRVALIGAPRLTEHYARALALQGLGTETADGSDMTRAGLAAAHSLIKETVP